MAFVWLLLGLLGAWGFVAFACSKPPAEERKIFAIGLIVAGLVYVGFALWWWQPYWVMIELVAVLVNLGFVYLAIRHSIYWLVFAWAIHPFWDLYIHLIGPASYFTPSWYPVFCVAFDLFVAVIILKRQKSWRNIPDRS